MSKTPTGQAVCVCGHPIYEHVTVCFIQGCDCQKFVSDELVQSDRLAASDAIEDARRVNETLAAECAALRGELAMYRNALRKFDGYATNRSAQVTWHIREQLGRVCVYLTIPNCYSQFVLYDSMDDPEVARPGVVAALAERTEAH